MSNSMFQAYTDYVTTINRISYDVTMNYVKTTHEFVSDVIKQNPYKDVFGVMDAFIKQDAKTRTK